MAKTVFDKILDTDNGSQIIRLGIRKRSRK